MTDAAPRAAGAGESGGIERLSLEYWSGRAQEYSQLHMGSYRSFKRMAFAEQVALSMPPGDSICALDLGCGSGFMSLLLLDAGCRVTGVDFSKEMLARARENIAHRGYAAELLQMRVQQLEFPDSSFDFVVSRNVTWQLEDVGTVYAEVMRVLKTGGVFLNLDANYGRSFNEATARGEVPTHPTQTLEQLRRRNAIVCDLPITLVDRPQWDIDQFWRLGASEVRCRRLGEGTNVSGSQMFALEVHGKRAFSKGLSAFWADDACDVLRVGAFEFDARNSQVKKNGEVIQLSAKEFGILLMLAWNAGETVSQAKLVESLWGDEYADEKAGLPVYIHRIRKKIEDDPSEPRHLLTCWGSGYAFMPEA